MQAYEENNNIPGNNSDTTVGNDNTDGESGCCSGKDGIEKCIPLELDTRFFKALCDPNRVAILIQLSQCCAACTVSEVASWCPIDVSVVSRHLSNLRDAGVVDATKRGKEVYYQVKYSKVVETLRKLADALEDCCRDANGQCCCDSDSD